MPNMPDSLHRTTTGAVVNSRTTPDTEIDPGPWGQTQQIIYSPGMDRQNPVTLIRGRIDITPQSGEPRLRTYSIAVQDAIQQPAGVRGPDPQSADVHLVASLSYGIGGAQFQTEVSIRNGISFTLPASYWDISAFIEPIPDMSLPYGALYPDSTSGQKTVQLYCSAALGSRQGGAVLPTRDYFTRFPDAAMVAPVYQRSIPQSAVAVAFYSNPAFDPSTLDAVWLGFNDMVIGEVNAARGVKNPIPPGARKLQFSPPLPLIPDSLVTESWELYL